MVARGWGRGNGKLLFNGDRLQFGKNEESSGDRWWLELHDPVHVQLHGTELNN